MSTPARNDATRLTSRAATWAIVAGLGVVLALFAAIAVAGAMSGHRAAEQVRRSGDLAGAYLRAQNAFSQEDAVEDVYEEARDEGSAAALRARFADGAHRLDVALGELERAGGPRDRRLARRALAAHAAYADAMRDIFDAADRGDEDLVEEINDERADVAQEELQRLINGAGPDHALTQLREIDALERTQRTVLDRTAVVVPIGLALYVALLAVFAAFRRRLERAARAELELTRAQARTDELTGLGNRRGFLQVAADRLEAAAGDGAPVALLLLDLDRFKEINDSLGHAAGDELLRQIAGRLRRALPGAEVLARLGGDEFVVLVAAPGGRASALHAAERLLEALDEPFPLDGLLAHVRASVGVALASPEVTEPSVLLRHADVAMYRAKAAGAGIELYADEDDHHGVERMVLAAQLHTALDDGQLVLHYQPKADLATGAVREVEALVRWEHPTRGLLIPDAFLPLAEQHGLMRRVTLRVLELAAAQVCAWQAEGRPLRVAVNVAPANLLDVRFPDEVAELLERTGAAPELLQLEITEDTIMVDPVRVLDVVARLGELGLAFALDDFGTGYSSLAYLKRLPVQELKIDRSFVMEMERSRDDAVIVRSTVELARNLGLRVVAEGVESHATWEQLAGFGCHGAQGYFLSPPLPPTELEAWLAGEAGARFPS